MHICSSLFSAMRIVHSLCKFGQDIKVGLRGQCNVDTLVLLPLMGEQLGVVGQCSVQWCSGVQCCGVQQCALECWVCSSVHWGVECAVVCIGVLGVQQCILGCCREQQCALGFCGVHWGTVGCSGVLGHLVSTGNLSAHTGTN